VLQGVLPPNISLQFSGHRWNPVCSHAVPRRYAVVRTTPALPTLPARAVRGRSTRRAARPAESQLQTDLARLLRTTTPHLVHLAAALSRETTLLTNGLCRRD